jgi:hypothetical protein
MRRKETDIAAFVHGKFTRVDPVLFGAKKVERSAICVETPLVEAASRPSTTAMARSPSHPNDQASSLRNLKLLVVVLAASNLLIGALGVYLLRSVDQRYSELVGHSVPALNDLRELMSDTVAAMRATNPRYFVGPGVNPARALQDARERLAAEQKFRAAVLRDPDTTGNREDHAAIQKLGDEFESVATEISQIYSKGSPVDVARLRDEKLLPVFDQYIVAIGRAADRIEATSLTTSKVYSSKTNTLSAVVLSVASWPVLVLALLLLVTAVFVIAMMIAFRGKDLADAP